jgi:hypothetical protein
MMPPAHWTMSDLAWAMRGHYPGLSRRALRRVVWDCINAGVLQFKAEPPATPDAVLHRRRLILSHGASRLPRAAAHADQRAQALSDRATA